MKKYLTMMRGVQDYLFRPDLFVDSDLGFNGQIKRQDIFVSIMASMKFNRVIETGTFRGVTTEFMSRHSTCPIFTVEQHPRYFGFSLARLFGRKKIRRFLSDSVMFLKSKLPKLISPDQTLFFYLDAHWETHLPLREELEIIFNTYPKSIVLIDDFEVPDDPGYRYDDYGLGLCLDLNYVRTAKIPQVRVYFPKAPSDMESGSKRGCVVLALSREHLLIETLTKNPNLREWKSALFPA